ncbi:MAG: DUF2851 family protein [bacterium]|nr:DUF2851 family protein [bacterium]
MTEEEIKAIWEGLSGSNISYGNARIFIAFTGVRSKFGPDFRSAVVFVDGIKIEGDAECHVLSSDWFRHKHNQDPNFSSVKIHIVWQEDVNLDGITISLSKIRALNSSDSFLCAGASEEEKRAELLRTAFVRLSRKAQRISDRAREVGDEQSLYEFLAEAFGYEKFRNTLVMFARRYSYETVLRAGGSDIIEYFISSFRLVKNLPSRPQNDPKRRIKSLLEFLKKNHPISEKILEFFDKKKPYRDWQNEFLVKGLGYGRFRTITANVLLPYIMNYRDKHDALLFFSSFPPEEINRVIKTGMKILNLKKINLVEGQGIMEIFNNRCSKYLCYLCSLRR